MVLELLLLLCALLLWWKVKDRQKYDDYPPGPWRLPLLGNLLQVALQFTNYPPLALRRLATKYGDVMFLKIGMMDTVIVSSHEVATEVFQSNAFDRQIKDFTKERNLNGNHGIIFATDKVWQTMRRFTIRTLRDFGFDKSAFMDAAINEEYDKFERYCLQILTKQKGIVRIENNLFYLSTLNVVWRLVTGKSHELDDFQLNKLLSLSHAYINSVYLIDVSIAYPALCRWFPKWMGKSLQLECVKNLRAFFSTIIEEHQKSQVYLSNPTCLIDVFLAKMGEENSASDFSYNQLVYILLDMFQAGSDTTSGALSFVMMHMLRNRDIQGKVRQEIISKLSPDSPVTTAMKQTLPFTHATILETLRFSNVVPFSIPREATKDVCIGSHKIKQGTLLIINLEAVHNQKSIWGDPEVFRPERFLTSDGTRINSKMTEYLMPFGGGRRVCLGQSLVETTLFIFFVNLIRRFDFNNVANQPAPRAEPKFGCINSPHPFDAVVTKL